jgi:multiple sugar transport system substrate-binding protein
MSCHRTRRHFLKTATVGGLVGLSGCIGGLTGGSGSTTVEYWEFWHSQSGVAEELMKSSIKEFEQNHDVNMKMNWSSWTDVTGGKWKSNMQNGDFPVIYDTGAGQGGQFIVEDWVKPVDEYIDRLDKEARDNIQQALELAATTYRGFGGANVYEVPVGIEPSAPFIARADHFEQAGLSIEEDFPPKNYEHLIEVATQLQKNGPGKSGFQIYGSSGDVTDEGVVAWSTALGGYDGLYLNKDWSDVNYDNDAWKTALERWVTTYQEHGLSTDQAPSLSNEAVAQQLIAGNVSMAQTSSKDFGLIRSRAPDMLENGTIQFGPSWEGKAGNRGDFWLQIIALMRRPPGVDKQVWQAREEMAIEWINKVLSKDFQREVANSLAFLPVRQDVQKELEASEIGGKSNFVNTLNTISSNLSGGWSAHPDIIPIQYDIAGPLFQQAVGGKISAEEACNTAAQRIRDQLDL